MKIRTVVISVVVTGSLIAGAGYGAYHAMQGKKTPVEVVPVSNVNMNYGWWGDENSIYGSVTSQASQIVNLNEEYEIEEIYVQAGDSVKEGTPLFSYDMTLPELELEMAKLNLQTTELTKVKLEKDLEKLKNTRASASLVRAVSVLTAAAQDELIIEEQPGNADDAGEASGAGQNGSGDAGSSGSGSAGDGSDAGAGGAADASGAGSAEDGSGDGGQGSAADGELSVDGIETVDGSEAEAAVSAAAQDSADSILTGVASYEQLVEAIDILFRTYGDSITSEDISMAISEAVTYYRKNFADEQTEPALDDEENPVTDAEGNPVELHSYTLKDSVRQAIGEEAAARLEDYSAKMDKYHRRYVELLIAELDPENPGDFADYVAEAREQYWELTPDMQKKVKNLERLEKMEERAAQAEENGSGGTQQTDGAGQPDADGAQLSESGADDLQPEDGADGTQLSESSADDLQPEDGADGTQPSESSADDLQLEDGADSTQPGDGSDTAVDMEETAASGDIQTESAGADDGQQMNGAETQPDGSQSDTSGETQPDGSQDETSDETQPDGSQSETQSDENQSDTSGETQPDGSESETSGETLPNGSESEISQETGQESGSEPSSETESGAEESETTQLYTVTAVNATIEGAIEGSEGMEAQFHAGDTVTVTANLSEFLDDFAGWEFLPAEVVPADAEAQTTTFVMPEADVTVTALFKTKMQTSIDTFISLAEEALGADGTQPEKYDADAIETAWTFYQANLADQSAEIVDGENAESLDHYVLKKEVKRYLLSEDKEELAKYLPERYRELCIMWVKTLIDDLDPYQLTRDAYEEAKNAYDLLGGEWRAELDQMAIPVQAPEETEAPPEGTVSENGQTTPHEEEPQTDIGAQWGPEEDESEFSQEEGGEPYTEDGQETEAIDPESVVLTYGERLAAYEVILLISEIDTSQNEDLLIQQLMQVRDAYFSLNDSQRAIVWNADLLLSLLDRYGLLQEETEPMTDFPFGPDDGFDDFGDEGYTAEELKEMIEEKEQEIKDCELERRSGEIDVRRKQRIVDEKVVKSTMNGTVISIGEKDGSSETDYFAKVANDKGLYAKGTMSELSLETIQIGDAISGTTEDGMSFTAVIKEISQYPDPNGSNNLMSYGSENSNVSYYPFYALIDDEEGITEGGATLQLSGSASTNDEDLISLESYFVRQDSDGKSYVYKQGEDGLLTKQYVTTNATESNYMVEIASGLSESDRIAFPYGPDVVEGAPTKEVDQLEAAYQ